jgi:hypothetical protein
MRTRKHVGLLLWCQTASDAAVSGLMAGEEGGEPAGYAVVAASPCTLPQASLCNWTILAVWNVHHQKARQLQGAGAAMAIYPAGSSPSLVVRILKQQEVVVTPCPPCIPWCWYMQASCLDLSNEQLEPIHK